MLVPSQQVRQGILKKKSTGLCIAAMIFLFTLVCTGTYAQVKKIAPAKSEHHFKPKPKIATLLSALLPGTGQVYNRKYWKAPIVWAASYGCFYLVSTNFREYNNRRNVIIDRTVNKPAVFSDAYADLSTDALIVEENRFRKLFEMGLAGSLVVYALNVVDANVDAHLFDFDISDDLSLHIGPEVFPGSRSAGVSLCLTIKK